MSWGCDRGQAHSAAAKFNSGLNASQSAGGNRLTWVRCWENDVRCRLRDCHWRAAVADVRYCRAVAGENQIVDGHFAVGAAAIADVENFVVRVARCAADAGHVVVGENDAVLRRRDCKAARRRCN